MLKQNAEAHHDSKHGRIFATAQCEAVRGRIPLSLGRHALIITHVYRCDHPKTRCSTVNHGNRRFEGVPICECAMRGSKRPDPALLVSPSTEQESNFPVMLLSVGVFGLAARSCPFEVPIWRNAQCDAVRRRIQFGSGLQASNTHNSRRRECQNLRGAGVSSSF